MLLKSCQSLKLSIRQDWRMRRLKKYCLPKEPSEFLKYLIINIFNIRKYTSFLRPTALSTVYTEQLKKTILGLHTILARTTVTVFSKQSRKQDLRYSFQKQFDGNQPHSTQMLHGERDYKGARAEFLEMMVQCKLSEGLGNQINFWNS